MDKKKWEKLTKAIGGNEFRSRQAACQAIIGIARFRIIVLLSYECEGLDVKDIVKILGATTSSVSHQLAVLRKHGIVHRKKNGNGMKYSLNVERLIEVEAGFKSTFGEVAERWCKS